MICTRDFLIATFLITLMCAGVLFFIAPPKNSALTPVPVSVALTAPRDSYEVTTFSDSSVRDERDIFIHKVQSTYEPPRTTGPAEDGPMGLPTELPTGGVSAVAESTTTYGNAHF